MGPEAVCGVIGAPIACLGQGVVILNGEVILAGQGSTVLLALAGACVVPIIWEAGLEGGVGERHPGDQIQDGQSQAPDVSWNDHFTQQSYDARTLLKRQSRNQIKLSG